MSLKFSTNVALAYNGQITQAKEQFIAMPKVNRREMVIAVTGSWSAGITKDKINILINLI